MDNAERNRGKGNSGRYAKQRSKKLYSKKRRNPNKGKKLVPKVDVEQLLIAEENPTEQQINVNVHIDTTVSSDNVELIEPPKDSVSPTGFRLIDLSILSNVFTLLACPNCLYTNTCQLIDIEEKKKGLSRYMQVKCNRLCIPA